MRLIEEAKIRFDGDSVEENSRRFLPQLLSIESLGIKDKLSMIFDMMLAAIDTTTYTVFKTLFYMAKHPDTQVAFCFAGASNRWVTKKCLALDRGDKDQLWCNFVT